VNRARLGKLFADYGNVLVLLLLCLAISLITLEAQSTTSNAAARRLAERVASGHQPGATVLVLVAKGGGREQFADTLADELGKAGLIATKEVTRRPADAKKILAAADTRLDAVAADSRMGDFCGDNLPKLAKGNPALADAKVWQPAIRVWPVFLKRENLLNIMKQISVVAVIAIGMTMVIITAGIDLSVGSLIAFSGVITALAIGGLGGADPTITHLLIGSGAGILACALIGMFTGGMVTVFNIPPFIVTLGIMFMARGLAYIFSGNDPVLVGNEAFGWLGRGQQFLGIYNSVILMLLLYAGAHVMMTRTSIGRYIYAVGGNPEAARLSGVPVKWVLVFVYTLCGLLAGLGGVMEASLHITGDPQSGDMVELQVIAAVVVGGTSLAGGQGRILGTLIGALIIAVIRNGMNLTGVEAHMQSVVYGVVILVAVLVDQLKHRGLKAAQ